MCSNHCFIENTHFKDIVPLLTVEIILKDLLANIKKYLKSNYKNLICTSSSSLEGVTKSYVSQFCVKYYQVALIHFSAFEIGVSPGKFVPAQVVTIGTS